MNRPDPDECKYGNPDWCHNAQPDGRKALSSLIEDFRETPSGISTHSGSLISKQAKSTVLTTRWKTVTRSQPHYTTM